MSHGGKSAIYFRTLQLIVVVKVEPMSICSSVDSVPGRQKAIASSWRVGSQYRAAVQYSSIVAKF